MRLDPMVLSVKRQRIITFVIFSEPLRNSSAKPSSGRPMTIAWNLHLATVAFASLVCTTTAGVAFSRQEPNDERQRIILKIQKQIEEHNLAAALAALDRAVQQFPSDAGFDNLRGVVEAQQGDRRAAERSFQRAVAHDSRFTGAYLNLGRLYQEKSESDPEARQKALQIYSRVLGFDPRNAEANYQSAVLLLHQGDYRASLKRISQLSPSTQAEAQTLSVICADYAGLGDRARADQSAADLRMHPDFSEADAEQALPGLSAGKRDDLAVSLLEALHDRRLLSPEGRRALGLAYERVGRFPDARIALEEYARRNPGTAPLMELARVAHEEKDYQGSLGYLAHARDLAPGSARIHYYFGVVCLDLNLVAEARNSFEKAVELEPNNPSYNYAMGATSSYRHDPSEAVPYFEKYLKLRPADPRAELALGIALFRSKDYDAALPHLEEATKKPETSTAAHYYLGSIGLQQHRLADALNELEQALRARPNYADAIAELGQYYLIRKNYDVAMKYLQQALDLDPDHYAANFYLLTLYMRTGDARREEQSKRFEELQRVRDEKSQELLRIVEVRPFETSSP
jgi:tetratricopeptide (TPR) repeat protein